MMANRTFILLSPFHYYIKKLKENYGGGSISEFLWLSDNGYSFEEKEGVFCAIPPASGVKEVRIESYAALRKTDEKEKTQLKEAIRLFCSKVPSQFFPKISEEPIEKNENQTPKMGFYRKSNSSISPSKPIDTEENVTSTSTSSANSRFGFYGKSKSSIALGNKMKNDAENSPQGSAPKFEFHRGPTDAMQKNNERAIENKGPS